ncbi:MAG: hypothetical protein U0441_22645 [Polyangiaceae bacterium]
MPFDVRAPIGLLFTILGILLTGYGVVTARSDMYARSLGLNINLDWGVVLLGFGLLMLWLGRRKTAPRG